MKILNIELHNFMSYKESKIDFFNIKVASIIGDNGSGKSSLLEAITYALFGITRAKKDDEICRNNEDCEVKIKFEIDNKAFTIKRIRKFEKSGKLQLFDSNDENITGTTTDETQKKIEGILNANYDTFVNSAFILQNKFDEFIKKTSSEKNQIFMSFLDI